MPSRSVDGVSPDAGRRSDSLRHGRSVLRFSRSQSHPRCGCDAFFRHRGSDHVTSSRAPHRRSRSYSHGNRLRGRSCAGISDASPRREHHGENRTGVDTRYIVPTPETAPLRLTTAARALESQTAKRIARREGLACRTPDVLVDFSRRPLGRLPDVHPGVDFLGRDVCRSPEPIDAGRAAAMLQFKCLGA